MSEVVIIAALAKNNVIGKDGKIPWHIKEDFQHFKKKTMNFPVIMGRKTFESLPIKPLPGRINIVLTRSADFTYPCVVVKNSMNEALNYCKDKEKIFIIGGAEIYRQGMEFADTLELTIIEKEYGGDTYFPEINWTEWELINKEQQDGYSFNTFSRKGKNIQ